MNPRRSQKPSTRAPRTGATSTRKSPFSRAPKATVKAPRTSAKPFVRASSSAPAPEAKPEYPMRINKYLAQKGYATRKAADELVEKRRVLINNKIAVLGDKVMETDVIEVRKDKKDADKKLVYFAYNKPRSVITHSAQGDETEIREMVPELAENYGVFPVGRLDKDSHGLIILTNDGRITDRLLSPTKEHDKEYIVQTKAKIRESFKERLESGVNIEGYDTKPAKVRIINENKFSIIITEGKKHQIRRMVVALFNEVADLERVRILNINLEKLAIGKTRPIEGEELSVFLKSLGL
jgi:23S rRNA pseudouridine2604 synthase